MAVLFQHALTSAPLPSWLSFELADPSRVAVSKSGLQLTLKPNDRAPNPKTGKPRAECVVHGAFPDGVERHLAIDFFIPRDWTDAHDSMVILQAHDQPVDGIWKGYPSHLPQFAVLYDKGELLTVYGTKEKRKYARPIKVSRARWHDLLIVFESGQGDEGSLSVWLDHKQWPNSVPVAGFNGVNGYNSAGAYLKFGLYADDGLPKATSIRFRNLIVSDSAQEVTGA